MTLPKKIRRAARYAVPTCIALMAGAFALLLVYPIMKLSPHGIPIAICSLDEGASVPGGHLNAGDELVGSITSADSGTDAGKRPGGLFSVSEGSVEWTVFDSEEDMLRALEGNEFYAAITIPADFSTKAAYTKGREALGEQLVEALPELASGSSLLAEGSGQVDDGAKQLTGGLSQLENGSATLNNGANALTGSIGSLSNGASSLADGLDQIQGGAGSLASGIDRTLSATEGATQLIDAAQTALEAGDYETAAQCLTQASQASAGTNAALGELVEGAQSLTAGAESAAQGAHALKDGTAALEAGASSLSQGTFSLSSGASSARNGASALASGTSQLSDGASTLSDSISTANDALSGIPMPEGAEEGSEESGNDEPTAGGLTLENSADESAPRIAIAINPAKNPMVTNSLESALTSLAGYGIEVDTTYTTDIPEELSTGYAHMPLLIITYLSSYAAGAAGAMLLKPFRRTRGRTALALLVQAMCALATALVIGAVATASFNAVLGAQVDFGSLALFLALCSFALQLVVVASLDLFGTPGMAVPLLLMGLCMLSAYLPYEFLPEFWQDCIYPYNPLRFMVDGFKSILYTDGGFINQATPLVANVAAVGAVLITLCLFKRPKEELGERMPAHLP